jgi:hypothetical protein
VLKFFSHQVATSGEDRYPSIGCLKTVGYFGVTKIRSLYEATYFAGLRKIGMPEE